MATSTIQRLNNVVSSASLSSGFTGNVWYVQSGKMVIVNLVVTNSTGWSANSEFATGLPRPYGSYTLGVFTPFGADTTICLTDAGGLRLMTALSASQRTFRCAFAYIAY